MRVRSVGPTNAKIMLVGEAPGEREMERGEPFVGFSGDELTRMLHAAGIMRSECFLTNVIRDRPPRNDISAFIPLKKKDITKSHVPLRDRMVTPNVREDYDLLKKEINLVKPNVIIALGSVALWALTGKWGIGDWRGSELWCDQIRFEDGTSPIVIPTFNPAFILRQWSSRWLCVFDFKKAAERKESRELHRPKYNFILRPDFNTALATLSDLIAHCEERFFENTSALPLSVDIETRAGHIACIGLAWSADDAICIPLMQSGKDDGYWNEEEEFQIVLALRQLLLHPAVKIIGQNFNYDAQYIERHWCFIPVPSHDTMLAQHALFPGMPKDLGFLSSIYCKNHVFWKNDGKTWDKNTGEEQLWRYNCEDCVRTFEIAKEQENALALNGLVEVNRFQQSLCGPVLRAQSRGVKIDLARRGQLALELQDLISEREQFLKNVFNHMVNVRSPKQLYTLFVDDLHLKPILKHRANGTYTPSFDDESLEKLGEREPLISQIAEVILDIRSLNIFIGTFVGGKLDFDSRMRCEYNVGGTKTYRFSSNTTPFDVGVNLQTIPKGDESRKKLRTFRTPNIRKMFVPDPGFTFFDIDLDSADLRIVTWESDCKEMKAMFRSGLKPYVEVAKEYYKDPSITKKHQKYPAFKSLCHGTNYLGHSAGIAPKVGLLVHEIEKIQRWYFGKFPEIKKWQDRLIETINTKRQIQNVWGYRFCVFDRITVDTYRELVAWIPQSSVAILINHGFVEIDSNLKEVQVLLQTHDSLSGQFPSHRPQLTESIKSACQVALPYLDPLTIPVDIHTSTDSWGECK